MKLSDIARLAGVSVTTASYVINGKAAQRRISAATVERVLAVVEEHGYQPDQQAAGLRRGQTRTLGFILPDLENPSYARLAKQLEQGARARGYQLLIACSDDEPETERQVVNLFRARRCDALIVASCLPAGDDTHARLVAEGLPVVAIDRQLDPQRFASVISDDQDAARRLTETLLQPAPRHIALLGARADLIISHDRAAGFRQALKDFRGEVIVEHAEVFSRECGRRLMEQLLERLGYLPDALVTTAYVLLEGVFDVFQARADGWPEGLRVATFGDTQLLDFVPLKVNSIYQQHALIAANALELALRAVEENDYRPGLHAVPGNSSCATEPAAMRLVDTHNHLDFPDFDADRAALLQRSRALGSSARWCSASTARTGNGSGTWRRPRMACTRRSACTPSTWRGTARSTWTTCASGCNACAARRSSARSARSAWTTTWNTSTATPSRRCSRPNCGWLRNSACRR